MNKKQAYLLTAYKDFDAVYELACFLSGADNRIGNTGDRVFIHVDKKSMELDEHEIERLNALPRCEAYKQYSIVWGGYNHVRALLSLMEKAVADKDVGYIHMLTGEDYPLRHPQKIKEQFVSDEHIYLDCFVEENFNEAVKKRCYYYNLFQDKNIKNPFLWMIQDVTVRLQRLAGIRRKQWGEFSRIYKGLVYFSMPAEAAADILCYIKEHPEYEKDMYRCQVPEEFFFHTLLFNETFCGGKWKNKIIRKELRYMNWKKGDGSSPVYLGLEDFDAMAASGCVFARKFHGKEAYEIKARIREELWS